MTRMIASFLIGMIVMFALAYLAVMLLGAVSDPGTGSGSGIEFPNRRSNLYGL